MTPYQIDIWIVDSPLALLLLGTIVIIVITKLIGFVMRSIPIFNQG